LGAAGVRRKRRFSIEARQGISAPSSKWAPASMVREMNLFCLRKRKCVRVCMCTCACVACGRVRGFRAGKLGAVPDDNHRACWSVGGFLLSRCPCIAGQVLLTLGSFMRSYKIFVKLVVHPAVGAYSRSMLVAGCPLFEWRVVVFYFQRNV